MARDSYHVIVYQILAYLYMQMKAGQQIDPRMIAADSPYLKINEIYWTNVMINLLNAGYIDGVKTTRTGCGNVIILDTSNCMITHEGLDYLCDNSFLNKAKEFLKDIKAIVPFI